MTEAEITKQIRGYLLARGIYHWKVFQSGRGFGRAKRGIADILGVMPPAGRILAIEVKAPKNKLSTEQQHFLDAVNMSGGLGIVARSLDDVIAALG